MVNRRDNEDAAIEFWARLNADGTFDVPDDVAARIDGERPVRVRVVVPADNGDHESVAWASQTEDQFRHGYAPSDAIYDDLPAG